MGIKQSDADLRAAGLTDIADKIKGVEDLLAYLQNPQAQQQQKQQPQGQQAPQPQQSQAAKPQRQRNYKAEYARRKELKQKPKGTGNHPLDTDRSGSISATENPSKGGKPAVSGAANAPGTTGFRGTIKY